MNQGIASYNSLDIDEAMTRLNKAIQLGLENKDDLIKAHRYLAFAYITSGENGKAKECFGKILKLDPLYELGKELSPKILDIFSEAQEECLPIQITAYIPRSISSPGPEPPKKKKWYQNPLALIATVGGLAYLASQAGGDKGGETPPPPPPGTVIASFASPGSHPQGLAWDGQYLWCADSDTDRIYKLNSSTGAVVVSIGAPDVEPRGITWDGQYLWCADSGPGYEYGAGRIYSLNPSNGSVITSFAPPEGFPGGLTWDGQYLWCAEWLGKSIYKLNPSNGSVITSFRRNVHPQGLAWDGQYLWNTDYTTDIICKISPSNEAVITSFASPGSTPLGLTWDGGYLWCSDSDTDRIYKIQT